MKTGVARDHFDRIAAANKAVGGIGLTLKNMKMQVLHLHVNRRKIPRFCLRRIDAAKKNHHIGHALISRIDPRGIGIRLKLPFGDSLSADGIRADQERRNVWDLALPNDSPANSPCLVRIKMPHSESGDWCV